MRLSVLMRAAPLLVVAAFVTPACGQSNGQSTAQSSEQTSTVVLAQNASQGSAQGDGPGRGGRMLERLTAMDADHDGSITQAEERVSREAMFTRLDANNDGFLSEDERPAFGGGGGPGGPPGGGGNGGQGGGGPGGGRGGGMARADTNNDGKVSRAEFLAQPSRMFERLDTDHNGTISAAEIETARAARANNGG